MACNGFNHRPNCNCGWGGQYHGSLGSQYHGGYSSFQSLLPPRSLVTPSWSLEQFSVTKNAQCPVCGAPVFFYKNSDGSRVFFDSLGPPWPKHPCTDNDSGKLTHHPSVSGPRTLQALLSQPIIDGGLWRELFDLIVREFGVPPSDLLNNIKLKQRSLEYIQQVRDFLIHKKSSVNTEYERKYILFLMQKLQNIESNVVRLIRAADIERARSIYNDDYFNDAPQLDQNLKWEPFFILRSTYEGYDLTVIELFAPYPSKEKIEIIVLGHVEFSIGSKSKILKIHESELYILHVLNPDEVAMFAVRNYSDLNLLRSK